MIGLSIDFDYFINTDIKTRKKKFIEGGDCLPSSEIEKKWELQYNKFPELKEIGLVVEYYHFIESLKSLISYAERCLEKGLTFNISRPPLYFMKAESHKDAFDFFIDNVAEIVNVDHHHDFYLGEHPDKLDCSNWIRILAEKRPKMLFSWVHNEDSEDGSLVGEWGYHKTTNFVESVIDFFFREPVIPLESIFVCFSPEYTPPHLRPYYVELCNLITKYVNLGKQLR